MSVLPIAKTFGKIAPGRAGAELPDESTNSRLPLSLSRPTSSGGLEANVQFVQIDRRSMHSISKAASTCGLLTNSPAGSL